VSAPPPPAAEKPKKEKDKKKKGKESAEDKAAREAEKAKAEADAKDLPCWERVPGLKKDQAGKASFVRVPFEIEVRGTFHQLTKYFWLIHEHAKTGRIITVENLTLESPKATADGMVVTARFTAVGFREADRPAAEAGEEGAAGAKGGKAVVRDAAANRDAQADAAAEGTKAPAAAGASRLNNPEAMP
jgi:hypothetical protein